MFIRLESFRALVYWNRIKKLKFYDGKKEWIFKFLFVPAIWSVQKACACTITFCMGLILSYDKPAIVSHHLPVSEALIYFSISVICWRNFPHNLLLWPHIFNEKKKKKNKWVKEKLLLERKIFWYKYVLERMISLT